MKFENKYLLFVTIAVSILISNCILPRDKETDFDKANVIKGFSKPSKLILQSDNLYILDYDRGIYKLDLTKIDIFSATTSIDPEKLIYNADSSGDPVDFDIEGDYLYSILYSTYHYILRYNLTSGTRYIFRIPLKLPAFNIDVHNNNIFLTGNMNMSLGVIKTSGRDDYILDETNDFFYSTETLYPGDFVINNNYIYVSSKDMSEIGIETYRFSDTTPDDLTSDLFTDLTKYSFDINIVDSHLILSTHNELMIYDITDNLTPTKIKTIKVGDNVGIYKTVSYNSNLVSLYGYEVIPSSFQTYGYDIVAYWSGIKIISNPYNNPTVEKDIKIEGWVTDCVLYNNHIISANQAKSILCINKIY